MKVKQRLFLMAIVCAALPACRSGAPAPTGTGAREVVTRFFEALAKEDWETAYAQLHADSRKRLDQPAFERQARAFRDRLGFPLGKVFLRSCDEQGDEAVARVILSDAAGSVKNRFHEGAVLKQGAEAWGIVLPENFGRGK